MSATTKAYDEDSALRNAPMTLARLTGSFLQVLRCLFSDAGNITIPALKDLVWRPRPDDVALSAVDSPLSIEPEYRFDAKIAMQRPFITVHRAPIQFQKQGIGGGAFQSPSSAGTTGRIDYLRFMTGTMVISAIAQHGAMCELMVDEIYRYFMQFFPHWLRELQLTKLEVAGIGDVQPKKEASELFTANVQLQYAYQNVWSLTPRAPELGGISLSVRTG